MFVNERYQLLQVLVGLKELNSMSLSQRRNNSEKHRNVRSSSVCSDHYLTPRTITINIAIVPLVEFISDVQHMQIFQRFTVFEIKCV